LFNRPKPTVGCNANGRRRRIIVIHENIFTDLEQAADTVVDMRFERFRKNSISSSKYGMPLFRGARNIF